MWTEHLELSTAADSPAGPLRPQVTSDPEGLRDDTNNPNSCPMGLCLQVVEDAPPQFNVKEERATQPSCPSVNSWSDPVDGGLVCRRCVFITMTILRLLRFYPLRMHDKSCPEYRFIDSCLWLFELCFRGCCVACQLELEEFLSM